MSVFGIGVLFHRSSLFFKTAKPFKNLSTAHGILSEGHFNHIRCFSSSVSSILTKFDAQSFFRFLGSSDCDDNRNTPVLYVESHENKKSCKNGTKCEQADTSQNTLSRRCVPVCLSVCPSERNNSAPTGRMSRKSVEKIKVSLQSDTKNGYFTRKFMLIYDNMSLNFSRMRMLWTKVLEKIKHMFYVQ